MALKRAVLVNALVAGLLATEAVQGAALPFQCIHDVHGSDCFSLGVLAVSHRVPDDVFQENLENTSALLVDETGDSLDSSSASQTPDGGFSDALDVVAQNFAVAFSTPLAESFASFTTSRHC